MFKKHTKRCHLEQFTSAATKQNFTRWSPAVNTWTGTLTAVCVFFKRFGICTAETGHCGHRKFQAGFGGHTSTRPTGHIFRLSLTAHVADLRRHLVLADERQHYTPVGWGKSKNLWRKKIRNTHWQWNKALPVKSECALYDDASIQRITRIASISNFHQMSILISTVICDNIIKYGESRMHLSLILKIMFWIFKSLWNFGMMAYFIGTVASF